MTGRVALVVGGSRGIGRAIAERLGAAGAHLAVLARDPHGAVADMAAKGLSAEAIACDLAVDDPAPAIARLAAAQGRLDILVYSAGANVRKPALEMTLADWRLVQRVNAEAAFLCAQAAAPAMIARGWGRVLLIGSVNTFQGGFQTLPVTAYATSKTALLGMTRGLAKEWAPHGVTVNLFCPGFVRTDFTAIMERQFPELTQAITGRVPMGRWTSPEEMAGFAAFLCSEEAGYMTGQTLVADGGFLVF